MGCKCAKQRTRELETAAARRRHLETHPLLIQRSKSFPESVERVHEYVHSGKGHIISTTCFRPKDRTQKLKGMVCYCHGYSSYTDWTDTDVAHNFVQRGFIFIIHDHYGHGKSDGDWLTNPTLSHDTYVDDAVYLFERAKRKFTPACYTKDNVKKFHYYLLGHSLGGAIALEMTKRYTASSYYLKVCQSMRGETRPRVQLQANALHELDDEKTPLKFTCDENDYIPSVLKHSYYECVASPDTDDTLYGWDGVILSAPMVKIKDEIKPPSWLIKAGEYLVHLLPNARIVPSADFSTKLTRNQRMFDFIQKSPLFYSDRPALRTGFMLMRFCEHIEREVHNIKLPMLILHGEKDCVTDPAMSQFLFDKCGCKDKKIKIFKDALHALLLDECSQEVYDEIEQWILQRNN